MSAIQSPPQISFDRILVLSDFQYESRVTLRAAATLARVHPAQLMVMHVAPPHPPREPIDPQAVLANLGNVPHEIILHTGDFWASVDTLVASRGVDLIVVSTHHRSDILQLLAGSTAEQLLRRVRIPVLTVGPGVAGDVQEPRPGQPVLFATDLSESSRHALPQAIAFAARQHGTLVLLHVVHYDTTLTVRPADADQQWLTHVREDLRRLLPPEPERPIAMEFFARFGFAAETIVETARARDASAIVLGIRGKAPEILSHLPTTLHDIIQDAPCPVLTVAA